MAQEIEARVFQKEDTLANWMANPLLLGPGEQAFVISDIDGGPVSFKIGQKVKKRFSDLPWPDFSVRGKVNPTGSFTGLPSGVYIPTASGTYGSVSVNLTDGYQVLYWDGATVIKIVFPIDLTGYSTTVATKAAFDAVTGVQIASTTNALSAMTTTASDSDVNYINLFDNTSIVTYNQLTIKLAVAGSVIVVKSSADFATITDIATLTALPSGISTSSFPNTTLAVGERIGVRTVGSCKIVYITSSGVGFRSTKSPGTTFPNQEVGYTLQGPAVYSTMKQLTIDNNAIKLDIASIKGVGTTVYNTVTNVPLSSMTQTSSTGTIYVNQFPKLSIPQVITSITLRQVSAALITLYDYDENNVQVAQIGTINGTGGDVATIYAFSYVLKPNHRLGVKSSALRYNSSGGIGCFDVAVGSVTATLEVGFTYASVNGYLDMSSMTSQLSTLSSSVATNTSDIATIKLSVFPPEETSLLSDNLSTGANWTAVGWTLAANKFTSTATGVANRLNLNKCYHADKRAARFSVQLSADSDLRIHCMYGTAALASGVGASMFGLDMVGNKFVFYTAAGANPNLTSTGVTTTVLQNNVIPFTLVASRNYILEVERDYTISKLRITDTLTGDTFVCQYDGWSAGQQAQNYGFFVNSGGAVSIGQTDVRITMKKVDYVIAGDSITAGEQVLDKTATFAAKFRAMNPNTVISARGGSTIDELILKLSSELAFIKPKYLILTIGINGGSTTGKIQTVVNFCNTNGIKLIYNHTPCARSGDEHIPVNALIDPFNLPRAYFDVATAKDNYPYIDGTHPSPRLNTSMFAADLTHPIESGHQAMFNRFRIDLPYFVK